MFDCCYSLFFICIFVFVVFIIIIIISLILPHNSINGINISHIYIQLWANHDTLLMCYVCLWLIVCVRIIFFSSDFLEFFLLYVCECLVPVLYAFFFHKSHISLYMIHHQLRHTITLQRSAYGWHCISKNLFEKNELLRKMWCFFLFFCFSFSTIRQSQEGIIIGGIDSVFLLSSHCMRKWYFMFDSCMLICKQTTYLKGALFNAYIRSIKSEYFFFFWIINISISMRKKTGFSWKIEKWDFYLNPFECLTSV